MDDMGDGMSGEVSLSDRMDALVWALTELMLGASPYNLAALAG